MVAHNNHTHINYVNGLSIIQTLVLTFPVKYSDYCIYCIMDNRPLTILFTTMLHYSPHPSYSDLLHYSSEGPLCQCDPPVLPSEEQFAGTV